MSHSPSQLTGHDWIVHYPKGVPAHLDYPKEPLGWLLQQVAEQKPDQVACHYFQQQITYQELFHQSQQLAAVLLRNGIRPGNRVGVLLPNIPEYAIALFGTWLAGGVAVPLNPLMVREEVVALLKSTDCQIVVSLDLLLPLLGDSETRHPAKVLVTTLADRLPWLDFILYRLLKIRRLGLRSRRSDEIPLLEALDSAPVGVELPQIAPENSAMILPTGGTTGRPKAVVLTHHNLLANAWQLRHWTEQRDVQEVILGCLPFFHSYGLTTCLLNGVAMGATMLLHHRFRPDAILKLIERQRPTLIPAVPAMLAGFNRVLRNRHLDLKSVRGVISGGAPLDPAVAAEFAKHTGAIVVQGYGLSEASPVTHSGPLDGTARPGTIGLPLPDTEALIVDAETGTREMPHGEVGELIIRGPQVMAGYWNDPEATAAALRDGWLFTGDLAKRDADGFFQIVDRKKDLIITSGVNVYPSDVEHVLSLYEGIEDIALLGVPDPDRGEVVKAVVVVKPGKTFNRRHFDEFAREHLEVHRRPRLVEVVTGPLPRSPLGKVLRRVLRDQYANESQTPGGG